MMKKISNLLMMALLTLGMGLTSCDEVSDNPVTPVNPEESSETGGESSETGGESSETGDKGKVTAITVDLSKIDEKYLDADKTKLQLTVGDELTLSFTILPAELADTKVELTSADATVLSIDGLKVKALKEGEVKVTAKAGDKTAECTVVVKAATVAVTGVTLDKTELALTIGDAAVQLTATVKPDNATDADVDWSSSDVSVATVDGSGLVTAVADGTATITAKAGDKTAECKVTVAKKQGTVSYATTAIEKVVGGAAFTNALTKTGDGTVKYASSKSAVATVNASTGEVTIVGAGETTITATVADGTQYAYATKTASYTLTVTKTAADFAYSVKAVSKTIGDAAFTNALTINGDGTVSYASSNTAVATVNASTGEVTIKGAGETTITATVADGAQYTYATKTATYTVTVAKKAGSISYTTTAVNKTLVDAAFTNALTKTGDGTVSYSSDNTIVATVNASTGEVTIVGVGTATITATATDSDTYSYATKTATYTVTVAAPVVGNNDPFSNGGDPLGSK